LPATLSRPGGLPLPKAVSRARQHSGPGLPPARDEPAELACFRRITSGGISEVSGSSDECGEHAVDVGEVERGGFLRVLVLGVLDRESPW